MSAYKFVREWLAEYKALPEAELNTYASTIRHNEELVFALNNLFCDSFSQEMVDPVCHQLFEFYRSGLIELQRFTLELIPTLIHIYLTAVTHNDKKKYGGIEACLLGIYNLEIVNKDGTPKVQTCTIPTLAVPSIYHEPPSLATLALTESALLRYHSDEPVVISIGPLPQVESINAQNRLTVVTKVLSCYNEDIAELSPRSHGNLCKMASRLTKAGFDSLGSSETDSINLNDSGSSASSRMSKRGVRFLEEPRIPLSSAFLVELLNGIYFVMFNGKAAEGIQTLEAVHQRANYELYADALLVTNAIKNSLMYNPSGQPEDGPMGISIALSPTATNPTFSKHAITNASFRAKKLPDDLEHDSEEDLLEVNVDHRTPVLEKKLETHDKKIRKSLEGESKRKSSESDKNMKGRDAPRKLSETLGDKEKEKKKSKEKLKLGRRNSGKDVGNRKVRITSTSEDIEVPEGADDASQQGAPPEYNELFDSGDRTKLEAEKIKSGMKLTKPLKGIMKKDKKVQRKESDRKRDSGESHSPRTSGVPAGASNIPMSLSLNGDITDASQVHVSVVRSSSRTVVDQIELKSRDSQHKRSSSNPEECSTAGLDGVDGATEKGRPVLQPASHMRDLRSAMNGADSNSSNGSLNTQL